MPCIAEGYVNKHSTRKRKWKEVKTGYTHFQENDIAIAKITPCFENRKSVIFHNLINGVGAGTTELHILRVIGKSAFPQYLLWILKTDRFIDSGIRAFSGAVGQKRIGTDFVSRYLIPLPSYSEQKRIAKIIAKFFNSSDIIEKAKNDMDQTIVVAKSHILELAIHGKLVPQDPNDEPASILLEHIREEKEKLIKQGKIKRNKKESVIFRGEDNSYYLRTGSSVESLASWCFDDLPETWDICFLGDVCDYGDCINIDTADIDDDSWILDLEDIEKDTGTVLQKVKKAMRNSVSTKHKFHKGQVLYSKLRPYLNKIVLSDDNGFCTSEILPLEFDRSVLPEYARYYLMSATVLAYADRCSYGVKMPRLGTTDGKKAIFSLPPLSEQKRIVETVSAYFEQLDCIFRRSSVAIPFYSGRFMKQNGRRYSLTLTSF